MPQTILTNNAQISYQYETRGTIIDSETQTNSVNTNIIEPNLSVLKTTASNYFAPNDKITYNLFLSNNALSSVHNIKINEIINSNFEYIENSAVATFSNGSSMYLQKTAQALTSNSPLSASVIYEKSAQNSSLSFKIECLEANANIMISYSVMFDANINSPEAIDSYSIVQYSPNDFSSQLLTAKSNTVSISKAFALLTASKSVDKETAFCGDIICYKILLSNSGNLDAINVHIADQLPSRFRFNNVKFKIADLPYNISFNVDENNLLTIPAHNSEEGLCIPSNTDDNYIFIYGTIDNE